MYMYKRAKRGRQGGREVGKERETLLSGLLSRGALPAKEEGETVEGESGISSRKGGGRMVREKGRKTTNGY
jgi:hypothetical protein